MPSEEPQPEPLRIAFLLPHFRPGGAERVVLNWIRTLDRSRFQPVLMLGKRDGAFLDELPDDVEPVILGGGRALLRPWHIGRQLRRHRVALAYAATNAMNLALMQARVRDTQRMISEHTMPDAYLATAKWRWFRTRQMRRLYPRADAVAVPTAAIARALGQVIGVPMRVHVLRNPVVDIGDSALSAFPARHGLHLVSAGRLVGEKGFDLLIDAVAQLRRQGQDCTLAIYGEGPLRPALQARIDSLGLGDHVHLRGHVADLRPVLEPASLFVLASRREGFGNVLIEAMAAGVPVLATRCGGPDSFITDGVNGWLTAPDDSAGLAQKIAGLLADPQLCWSTVAPAFKTAAHYDVAQSTRHFERLISAMVSSRA